MDNDIALRINKERLWDSIHRMAVIGATAKGGCRRLALTDEDVDARKLFLTWAADAGCSIRIDSMGNIFARRAGLGENSLAPVATGSHLDTQPSGGKFDGPLGVICGIEVLRTLDDLGINTEKPLEVIVWTNEEGSRFAPAMVGSGVFSGIYDLEYGLSRSDRSGVTIGEELNRLGYSGSELPGNHPLDSFFEVHIEQGPILEANGKTIGIVTGAQAQRWYEVTINGQEAHAGTTPMERRKDALVGAAQIISYLEKLASSFTDSRATVGLIEVSPNSRNTIPGHVFFTIDIRHPDDIVIAEMASQINETISTISTDLKLSTQVSEIWQAPSLKFDGTATNTVRSAVKNLELSSMEIVSGAGHDACQVAHVVPTAMIFIPCADGISHNEIESASISDVEAGCNVLLNTILAHAGRIDGIGSRQD